jgi:hypothetical protein
VLWHEFQLNKQPSFGSIGARSGQEICDELADALSGGVIDGVGDRCRDADFAELANPARPTHPMEMLVDTNFVTLVVKKGIEGEAGAEKKGIIEKITEAIRGGEMEEMHAPKYKALEDSAAKCVVTGNDCLRHCYP